MTAPPRKEKKKVWFKCRREGCSGTSAEMVVIRSAKGSVIRYKCLTCNRIFVISR